MKNYKLLISGVVCGAIMLFNSVASADEDKQGVVTVVGIRGHGDYSIDGGKTWKPSVVGQYYFPGTIIKSEDLSTVDLLVGKPLSQRNLPLLQLQTQKNPARNIVPQPERNLIRLRPNTVLGLDKLVVPGNDQSSVSDAELNLKKGKILASVKKVSPSSEYLVKVPNAVAAVRGTQFVLSTDGDQSSTCSDVTGTVWISFTIVDASGNVVNGPNGQPFPAVQISLNPGQTFSITPGLLSQLTQQIKSAAGSGTPTDADLAALAAAITTLATSSIGTIDAATMADLEAIFGDFDTIVLQYTGQPPETYDNGVPAHVSSY